LKEELEFLSRYLEIEQVRFGERLKVSIAVPAGLEEASVPNMILQPIVENAIKHGISKIRGEAILEIAASKQNGNLTLCVHNNGYGISTGSREGAGRGIGIVNTRARLERLYGPRQSFELRELPAGGVSAELTIPYSVAGGHEPGERPDA
jgi:sensor histidine kinase YesM